MRVSTLSLLALPVLAAAQQDPFEQAKAQAQYWFDKLSSFIPNPSKATAPEVVAKAGSKTFNVLTLENWESTIRSSVKPTSTSPEEWWVLVTGGNTTCFGSCGKVETAFNETAALWATNPAAPHTAYLNCENQPVLCNSWGGGPPSLWIFEVSAPPAPVDVRYRNLNHSQTDVKTFTDLYANQEWKSIQPYEGYFHPFDGPLAQYGLAVPLGYVFWFFNVVPSWLFMIMISFLSRNMMLVFHSHIKHKNVDWCCRGKRAMGPQPNRPAAGAAGARVGAPPGDGIRY
jgi:hypothetical protein